jgi:hypothetical protein
MNMNLIISDRINKFQPFSLDKLERMNLVRRYDTKFIMNIQNIDKLLNELIDDYKILEINHNRIFKYENFYFDTPDLYFYRMHHNNIRKRYKIRMRRYQDMNKAYFEIKIKNNTGQTSKIRNLTSYESMPVIEDYEDLITDTMNMYPKNLKQLLNISYDRISLINDETNEKITIDTQLQFKNSINKYSEDDLVILELKQKKRVKSKFEKIVKKSGGKRLSISKYVYGTLKTHNDVKYNNFKNKIIQLNKVSNGTIDN